MMFFYKRTILAYAFMALLSCSPIIQFEKTNLLKETNGFILSSMEFSSHTPAPGDSVMFEINAEKLKSYLEQNKGKKPIWLHFVYSRLCANAELYDCNTYKFLNEKYRNKLAYIMITEIAHSSLAHELRSACNLTGYLTYVDNKSSIHNEVKTLRKFKKETFGFKHSDTLLIQSNYLIINNKIVYASNHTIDREKMEAILDKYGEMP